MLKFLISFLLISTSTISLLSQSFEGVITYKITYKNLSEDVKAYELFLPKKLTITLKGKKNRIDQNTMGVDATTIFNYEDSTGIMLTTSIFNKEKNAIILTLKDINADNNAIKKNTKTKFKKEKKEIAGYNCKKAIVTDSAGVESIVWYTTKIPKLGHLNQQITNDIEGFYMEYSTVTPEMTMIITAKSVGNKKIDNSVFEVPEGYSKMTMDEFTKSQEAKQKEVKVNE
jgi:hypothetical protein